MVNGKRAVKVLVVDDEKSVLKAAGAHLGRASFQVVPASDTLEGLQAAKDPSVDVAVVDLSWSHGGGLDLVRNIKKVRPDLEVITMTSAGLEEVGIESLKSGAFACLKKPVQGQDLIQAVSSAAERRYLKERTRSLEMALAARSEFQDIVGHSAKMRAAQKLMESVAFSSATVFVQGEAGTGKELVARALHFQSNRRDKAFLSVNCSALSETQLESELFGHVRGAVPGTSGTKRGLFEIADGGTVFLDDVGDLSASIQVRLLRLLGDGELRRIGSSDSIKVDVRVIASGTDLPKLKSEGKLREDLFGKLTLVAIELPALRDRAEDIPLLAQHFVTQHAKKAGKTVRGLTPAAQEAIARGRYPGNVRELSHVIERAVVLAQGELIDVTDLPQAGARAEPALAPEPEAESLAHLPYAEAKRLSLCAFERRYLSSLLEQNHFNISSAARAAGVDRSNFRRLLKQYEVARNGPASLDDDGPIRLAPAPTAAPAPRPVVAVLRAV